MLMKLAIVVNFTNILQTAIVAILFYQKIIQTAERFTDLGNLNLLMVVWF